MYNQIVINRGNNSKGRKDATGAFIPEAKAMTRILRDLGRNVSRLEILTDGYRDRVDLTSFVLKKIDKIFETHEITKISGVSLFCHGWRKGVELLPRGEQGAKKVARVLANREVKFFNLFACSAGKPHPKGNWAQWVTEECVRLGHSIQVFSHETPGHTTWNPNVNLYWSDGKELHQTDHDDFVANHSGFADLMKDNQEFRLMLPFNLDEV